MGDLYFKNGVAFERGAGFWGGDREVGKIQEGFFGEKIVDKDTGVTLDVDRHHLLDNDIHITTRVDADNNRESGVTISPDSSSRSWTREHISEIPFLSRTKRYNDEAPDDEDSGDNDTAVDEDDGDGNEPESKAPAKHFSDDSSGYGYSESDERAGGEESFLRPVVLKKNDQKKKDVSFSEAAGKVTVVGVLFWLFCEVLMFFFNLAKNIIVSKSVMIKDFVSKLDGRGNDKYTLQWIAIDKRAPKSIRLKAVSMLDRENNDRALRYIAIDPNIPRSVRIKAISKLDRENDEHVLRLILKSPSASRSVKVAASRKLENG
jgi:hypothetical protein